MSVGREDAYVGEKKTHLRHGYGVYKYPNQFFRYEGEWKHGKKHGHGKLLMADGSFYEGEFINGEIEGHGFRKWAASGNTYSGQFSNGELNGYGVMNYHNGSVYEGEFQCNKKEGRGVMKYEDGSIYEGLFHNNLRHGEGSLTSSNGDRYIGDWVRDSRQGSGELHCKDGSVYDGQWRNDLFNGAGTLIHSSGVTYDGMWINGRPAVEAARIVITSEECQELSQDAPFSVSVEIQSGDGQVVTDEQGRELSITAGFKHQIPGQGSPLLALIEDLDETPVTTPYYDVINYPITEYSFLEERLKASEDDPSSGASDLTPSANDEVTEALAESVADLDLDDNDDQPDAATGKPEDMVKPGNDDGEGADETTGESLPEICSTDDTDTVLDLGGEHERAAATESPIPPSVANIRSEAGRILFQDLSLVPPPGGYRPFSILDLLLEEEALAKIRNSRTGSLAQQLNIGAKMGKNLDQVNFEKIKDPKVAKIKRERLYGDERFARPGEYVIIVSDVTEPPFLDIRLPPAYCRIKVLHPRKVKKDKPPAKSKSNLKTAE